VMAAINRKQALLPASAEMIDNPIGTACGFAVEMNGCWIFFTPGVPAEFKMMVEQQILPRIRVRFPEKEPLLCLRLTTFGRSESSLASQLSQLSFPEGSQLGYRSSMPIIELKLTGPGHLQVEMESAWQQVRELLQPNTIYEGTEGLPHWLSKQLRQRQLTVAVSEQFSAGLLHWQLRAADVPLKCGELLPAGGESDSEDVASWARLLCSQSGADIVLANGELHDAHVCVVLQCGQKSYSMTVQYRPQHHSMETRQKVIVMLLQDMLRRWLNGQSVYGDYEWLMVTDTIETGY
ncbi:MAG: nicotinamide mononucleotide deamidase-related protein YfaY, partial [Enterobacteriaceae bacterium]